MTTVAINHDHDWAFYDAPSVTYQVV